jgi:hypothetical protein
LEERQQIIDLLAKPTHPHSQHRHVGIDIFIGNYISRKPVIQANDKEIHFRLGAGRILIEQCRVMSSAPAYVLHAARSMAYEAVNISFSRQHARVRQTTLKADSNEGNYNLDLEVALHK